MNNKLKRKLAVLIVIILVLVFSTLIYRYAKNGYSGLFFEKEPAPGVPPVNILPENKKIKTTEPETFASPSERKNSSGNTLIEGIVVNKTSLPSEKNGELTDNYFIYVRDKSGGLRKFKTTESNYFSVKVGDNIIYKRTSKKNYKLIKKI